MSSIKIQDELFAVDGHHFLYEIIYLNKIIFSEVFLEKFHMLFQLEPWNKLLHIFIVNILFMDFLFMLFKVLFHIKYKFTFIAGVHVWIWFNLFIFFIYIIIVLLYGLFF